MNERRNAINRARKRDEHGRFMANASPSTRRLTVRLTEEAFSMLELTCDMEQRSQANIITLALERMYNQLKDNI